MAVLEYLRKSLVFASVMLLPLSNGSLPARAQSAGGEVAAEVRPTPPAWPLTCSSTNAGSGSLQCQMSQTIFRRETGQVLMVVTIRTAQDGSASMNFVLPHGLFLPAGVSYQVDTGGKAKAVIYSSDQNGAYAVVSVGPDLLKALRAGSELKISLESVSREELAIPISLAGFASAIDRLLKLK